MLEYIKFKHFIIKFSRLQMQFEQKCVKCSDLFTNSNVARIIPSCGHNICNLCVKKLLQNKQKEFKCRQCDEIQLVDEDQIQNFPKNITIIKQIRESSLSASIASQKIEKKIDHSDVDINSSSILLPNDSSKYSSFSDRSSNAFQLCPKHGKPLQIICIQDHGLLCPHCAIFGEHRNHEFKTIVQFEDQIKSYQKNLKQISGRKKNADFKIRGQNYRKDIQMKIVKKKEQLIKQIKNNFAKLSQLIKSAQMKVLDQLFSSFRKIDSDINRMTQNQNRIQELYEEWKRKTYDYISKIQHQHELNQRIALFYSKSKPNLKEGTNFVQDIEQKNKGITETIKLMIESIHMEYSVSIEGYIYNYARVVVNSSDLTQKTVDIAPRSKSKQKQQQKKRPMRVQFVKSDGFIKSQNPSIISQKKSLIPKPPKPKSPQLYAVRSNPKTANQDKIQTKIQSPTKKLLTPNKLNKNKRNSQPQIQADFQFAERMLNQFKQSTDTLDITGCELGDNEIVYLVNLAAAQKPIKCLKLGRNKLTTIGLKQIIPHLLAVTNINISHNLLNDESMDQLIKNREYLPNLRVVNVSQNKLNERKVKTKIEELKRMGIIITM